MKELKCPNCGTTFQIDESGYASIVQQIRDEEFTKELKRREDEMEAKRISELEMDRFRQSRIHESEMAEKDKIIASLLEQINNSDMQRKLAVAEALQNKEKELSKRTAEIVELKGQLTNISKHVSQQK